MVLAIAVIHADDLDLVSLFHICILIIVVYLPAPAASLPPPR